MKLRKIFKWDQSFNIKDDDIINTIFEMLFRDGNEKIEISESIKDALLNELIQEIKKKKT